MGVKKYTVRGKTFWRIDETVTLPDGRSRRFKREERGQGRM